MTFPLAFGRMTNTYALDGHPVLERTRPWPKPISPGPSTPHPLRRPRRLPSDFLYLACLHEGTGVDEPDFIAVVDADPDSDSYGEIVHETPMPNAGDELHHFGWNRCSSACHGPDRSHLIVPGFRSSRIHILNVADDPRRPRLEKVIEPEELAEKTGYSRPHTVHCMPGDNVVVSMLGDATAVARAASPVSTRAPSRSRAAGRTAAPSRSSTTTSGTSRARTS